MRKVGLPGGVLLAIALAGVSGVAAQDDVEAPPISYSASEPVNCISRLQEQVDRGETVLQYEPQFGYLRSLLAALDVPVESQGLVFSKSSLQIRRISPRTPRAVYFNEDVYIGYCQKGDVLEISAVDPQLGTVFYMLDQRTEVAQPRFERRVEHCLVCHSSALTGSVPGHLVRSLFVDRTGQPVQSASSYSVDHTTPIEERWGGWYVTGRHGSQKHLGNLTITREMTPAKYASAARLNVESLSDRIDVAKYLSPHSDLVALMILEHQTLVQNRLTSAGLIARQELAAGMSEKSDASGSVDRVNSAGESSVLAEPGLTTNSRIRHAGDRLVEALLLVGEAPLKGPVAGTSTFADVFQAKARRDSQGRSLRDLDLTRRLFQYPCSYLIGSEAFAALPEVLRDYVWHRLWQVLSGQDRTSRFEHLSADDRAAILMILCETEPNVPAAWKTRSRRTE